MKAAETKLKNAIFKALGAIQQFPDVAVASIRTFGLAEDNETFLVLLDMADGTTAAISICPGKPIACSLV